MWSRPTEPLTVVNSPPTYTVDAETASADTPLLAFGSHVVATPVVASSAARLCRVSDPLTVLNVPPTYTVAPDTAKAETTTPDTAGSQLVTTPVPASKAARLLRATDPLAVVKGPPA